MKLRSTTALALILALAGGEACAADFGPLLLGVGSSGPATAAAFVPNAVLIHPEASPTWSTATSNALSNSPTMWMHFIVRCSGGTVAANFADANVSCLNAILAGGWDGAAVVDAEHQKSFNVVYFESPASGGQIRYNAANATGGNNNSANGLYTGANLFDGEPHSVDIFVDVSQTSATNQRAGGVAIDGVQVGTVFTDQPSGQNWSNASKIIGFASAPFYLNAWDSTGGSNQDPRRFEISQFMMDLNAAASPVQAGTNLPAIPLSHFYNPGVGPVDVGSDGSLAFGHVPTIALLNPAASFLTNLGTGPSPVITNKWGSTVSNKVYEAQIRPSETLTTPAVRWHHAYSFNGQCAESAKTCTIAGINLNNGNSMKVGDKHCVAITTTSSGGAVQNYNDAFSGPAGYTDALGGTFGNNGYQNLFLTCKDVSSAVASGSDMGSLTITWANANASGWQSAVITSFDIAPKAGSSTVNIAGTAVSTNTASTSTLDYPSLTSHAGNSLIFYGITIFDWTNAGTATAIGPATTATLVGKEPASKGSNEPMITTEKSTGIATFTRTAQGAAAGLRPTAWAMEFN